MEKKDLNAKVVVDAGVLVVDYEGSDWRDMYNITQIATYNTKTKELIVEDSGDYDDIGENYPHLTATLTE